MSTNAEDNQFVQSLDGESADEISYQLANRMFFRLNQ